MAEDDYNEAFELTPVNLIDNEDIRSLNQREKGGVTSSIVDYVVDRLNATTAPRSEAFVIPVVASHRDEIESWANHYGKDLCGYKYYVIPCFEDAIDENGEPYRHWWFVFLRGATVEESMPSVAIIYDSIMREARHYAQKVDNLVSAISATRLLASQPCEALRAAQVTVAIVRQQRNTYDCGMFVIVMMEHLLAKRMDALKHVMADEVRARRKTLKEEIKQATEGLSWRGGPKRRRKN
jgi:hypothetical protein